MNYREKMREYLKEPSINGSAIGYGKWCTLNHEQRTLIKRLLDEMDKADDFNKNLHLKNQQLKEQLEKEIQIRKEAINYINNTKYSDIVGLNSNNIKDFWFMKDLLNILEKSDK